MLIELPAFFDLQVNGFAGVDFNAPDLDPDRILDALDRMSSTGVTRCLPTLITSSFDRFAAGARAIARLSHPSIAGIPMEGPYISPEDGARGAHPAEHVIAPSADDFARRQDAADGHIVLVTMAAEAPGAPGFIEHLVASGVRVALGHTAASPLQIADAIAAGATLATHLGNGCAQMLPRHPNVIWELLAADGVFASLIVDGHHLPPSTVKAMIRAKDPRWTLLVTDATAAAGSPPGEYTVGAVTGTLGEDGRMSLPGTPYLAGSSLTMDRAVANTVRFSGLTLEEVVPMASSIPAACLGMRTAGRLTADWNPSTCALHVVSVMTP